MKVCILGNGLSSLTLAKALVNQNIYVELIAPKKNLKIDQSRTLGISKSNIDFFKKNIINVEKLLWKLKRVEIYTDNLKNEKLLNFENNNEQMLRIDFNDLMWEDNLESKFRKVPNLHPSDILVVPGEPRLYFMDWFSIGLSVFSALISLTILILNIQKN